LKRNFVSNKTIPNALRTIEKKVASRETKTGVWKFMKNQTRHQRIVYNFVSITCEPNNTTRRLLWYFKITSEKRKKKKELSELLYKKLTFDS